MHFPQPQTLPSCFRTCYLFRKAHAHRQATSSCISLDCIYFHRVLGHSCVFLGASSWTRKILYFPQPHILPLCFGTCYLFLLAQAHGHAGSCISLDRTHFHRVSGQAICFYGRKLMDTQGHLSRPYVFPSCFATGYLFLWAFAQTGI